MPPDHYEKLEANNNAQVLMKAIAENLIKVSIREKDEVDLTSVIGSLSVEGRSNPVKCVQSLDKELIIPYNLGN